MSLSGVHWDRLILLLRAAHDLDAGFKIMFMPDSMLQPPPTQTPWPMPWPALPPGRTAMSCTASTTGVWWSHRLPRNERQ